MNQSRAARLRAPCPSGARACAPSDPASNRVSCRPTRSAESVVAFGELYEQRRRLEARAVFGGELARATDEGAGTHVVDELEHAARPRRGADPKDGTDVRIGHRAEHAFCQAAHRFEALDVKEPILELAEF